MQTRSFVLFVAVAIITDFSPGLNDKIDSDFFQFYNNSTIQQLAEQVTNHV